MDPVFGSANLDHGKQKDLKVLEKNTDFIDSYMMK